MQVLISFWPMSGDLHKWKSRQSTALGFSTCDHITIEFGKACYIKNSFAIQFPKIKLFTYTPASAAYIHPHIPTFTHPSTYKHIAHQSCIGWHLYNYQWIDCMLGIKCWYRHNCLFEWIYKISSCVINSY